MSHRLSRRLNNATDQCPVVCPSHVDKDATVARGVMTYRCPVVRPVVPSLFRPTALKEISDLSGCKKELHPSETLLLAPFRDDVTKKEDKLIKEALFQFICDTKVKI